MNVNTGQMYSSLKEALKAGEKEDEVVEVRGSKEAISRLSRNLKVKEQRRAANKKARSSRTKNRSKGR